MKLKQDDWIKALIGFLVYLGTAGMGLELALWKDFAPLIWPPAGFGLALLLLMGRSYWPIILAGSFVVSYLETGLILSAGIISLGYTLAGWCSARILARNDFRIEMERIRDVMIFVGVAVLLAPLLSAGVYTVAMQTERLGFDLSIGTYFSVRWLSDALGTLALTPVLVVWFSKSKMTWRNQQAVEVLLWLGILIFLGAMVFRNWAPTDTLRYPLELAMFPLTAWAGIRFGQRGATLAVLIISLMAVWELRDVISLEATRTITQPPGYLWVFVGVLSITSLFLAAVLSELRSREETTRQNEQRLAGFIRALPDLAFVYSSKGICEDVFAPKNNPLFEHVANLRGKPLEAIYPEGLAQAFRDTILKAIASGEVEILRFAMAVEGEDRWFEGRFAPIETSGDEAKSVISFAYDVTQNQRANQELQSRDRLLQTLTQAESVLLREKSFEQGLKAALNLVGKGTAIDWIEVFSLDQSSSNRPSLICSEHRWSREDLMLPDSAELIGPLCRRLDLGWLQKLKNEESILFHSGDEADLENSLPVLISGINSGFIYPLFVGSGLYGFVFFASADAALYKDPHLPMILRSISENLGAFIESRKVEEELFRAKESAESADLAKGEFLAMMSHEIRTPMNAIVGFADLLKKTKMSPDQEEFIGIINRSGKELLELINNILDFSKLESNRIQLEETIFLLETTVVEALEMVLMKARSKGIDLDYELNDDSSGYYIGDPLRIRQVLVNLLSNAVKFTKEGSVRLSVNVNSHLNGYRQLIFEIKDTGIGIPKGKIDDLFKPFEQLDSSTTREFGGTGLGLTIVDRIVKKLGGTIRFESEVGVGSTVTIQFALLSEASPKHYPIIHQADETKEDSVIAQDYPLNFLIIESEEDNARLIEEILHRMGYQPKAVSSGEEGILALRNGSYDVVLMGLNLPNTTEKEMVEAIRSGKCGQQHRRIQIVALTARALQSECDSLIEAGFDHCLVKPFRFDDLKDRIPVFSK